MNTRMIVLLLGCVLFLVTTSAVGQMITRTDAIWARASGGSPITLDGALNEAAWAAAESVIIQFGVSGPIPGSGYREETGITPTDPAYVTYKLLTDGDTLYLAAIVRDSSIGGGLFNRFDGFIMNLRRHEVPDRPAPPFEYFYGWVTEPWACDTLAGQVGASPCFLGFAAGDRTVWDAVTWVHGVTNDDATPDTMYVVEFKFNLIARGYNITQPSGEIVEFNISLYDADWQWPDQGRFSGNRTWWQGPWGNTNNTFNLIRIHARPDVTTSSGAAPTVPAEVIVPNGQNFPAPTIDGNLNEGVWQYVPSFDIRFGDVALRNSYPSVGPYRSGQFQPALGGITAPVLDPGDVTIKWFFKDDSLYIAADVRDQVVQANSEFDRWDGIQFFINDRGANDALEHNSLRRELIVRFDSAGTLIAGGYLPYLRDSLGGAAAAVAMKAGTTINDFNDVDAGFNVELAIDLTKVGYPTGRGDGILFISALLYDGDSFPNPADDYGARTWWFREHGFAAGPAWAYMDPTVLVNVEDNVGGIPKEFAILGNYPNPFNPSTTIRYTLPEAGAVTLQVFDVLGREVANYALGLQQPGVRDAKFDAGSLSSGVYFYRLKMVPSSSNRVSSTLHGKAMLLK